MAHLLISTSLLLLLSTLIATAAATPSAAANLLELETMMETLRPLGYTLFCNAITTSDLQFLIVSSNSISKSHSRADDFYTIFAAKDPYLYALDMASDAAAYVSTLRYHVSPNRRLTHEDLRTLKSPFLETLLPHYSILVSKNKVNDTVSLSENGTVSVDVVRVDGVPISDPDIFVGSRIVVHGLDGILVTGIMKNDDLVDDERKLGFVSDPTAAPVVVPPPEQGVSVMAPFSAPSPPPMAIQTPVVAPVSAPPQSPVVVPYLVVAPASAPPQPTVEVQTPGAAPVSVLPTPSVVIQTPVVAPVSAPSPPPVVIQTPVVAPVSAQPPPPVEILTPVVVPAYAPPPVVPPTPLVSPVFAPAPPPVVIPTPEVAPKPVVTPAPVVGPTPVNATDVVKRLRERPAKKHQPPPLNAADAGKGLKEARRGTKHQPPPKKHLSPPVNAADAGKGLKEARRGTKHQPPPEKATGSGKGLKKAMPAKYRRVTHQNQKHQLMHNNRRRQNRRNRVHRKDDL